MLRFHCGLLLHQFNCIVLVLVTVIFASFDSICCFQVDVDDIVLYFGKDFGG